MFNAKEEVEKIIKFIRDYYEKNTCVAVDAVYIDANGVCSFL